MYIKFLDYQSLEYVKNNIDTIYKRLKSQKFFQILEEELGQNWAKDSKFIKPKIVFVTHSDGNPRKTDFENAKQIYESFINLTESQASDMRLWAGYSMEDDVYDYLKYRWKDTDRTVKYRVVGHATKKRGLMYNGIARLWWFTHITYDKTNSNPYLLTDFAFKYPHILEKMIYRNYSKSDTIRLGIIQGIYDFVQSGGEYRTKKIDRLYVHISTLGSVSLIDSFSKENLREITLKELMRYN